VRASFLLALLWLVVPADAQVGLSGGPSGACWTVGGDGWLVTCAKSETNGGTCNTTHTGTSDGTCIYYVSASGSGSSCAAKGPVDPNFPTPCGLTGALAMLRDGKSDWLLIKCGDTFTTIIGRFGTSGASATAPQMVSNYGPEPCVRPLFSVLDGSIIDAGGGGTAGNYTVITGLNAYHPDRDPDNAAFNLSWASYTDKAHGTTCYTNLHAANWLWIEDFGCQFFSTGFDIEFVAKSNFTFRRNQILNNTQLGSYWDTLTNVLAEGNLFDNNGWMQALATAPVTITNNGASPATFTWGKASYVPPNSQYVTLTGTLPTGFSTSALYCVANVSGATANLAPCGVAGLYLSSGGSGYNAPATYNNVPITTTGGTGTGFAATATFVVSGGAVTAMTNVTITNPGTNFSGAENYAVSNTNLGGSGSGITIFAGSIGTLALYSPGSGYVDGTYNNVPITNSGAPCAADIAATATFVVSGGVVTSVSNVAVSNPGTTSSGRAAINCNSNTIFSASNANLGGSGSGLQLYDSPFVANPSTGIAASGASSNVVVNWSQFGRTVFKHNLYDAATNRNVHLVNNISHQASLNGLMGRQCDECRGNVSIGDGSAGIVSGNRGGGPNLTYQNLIVEQAPNPGCPLGVQGCVAIAINSSNDDGSSTVPNVGPIFAFDNIATQVTADINIAGNGILDIGPLQGGVGPNLVTATGNIVCNAGQSPFIRDEHGGNNTTSPANTTKANDCNGFGFPNPTLSVGSFNAQIPGCGSLAGGCTATSQAWIKSARAMSKSTWNYNLTAPALNNYIRVQGFGLAPAVP